MRGKQTELGYLCAPYSVHCVQPRDEYYEKMTMFARMLWVFEITFIERDEKMTMFSRMSWVFDH